MSAQTSYEINQPVGYAGLVYAQAPHDIVSRYIETEAGIPFGVAVSRGTDTQNQVVLGGVNFTGITIRSLDKEGVAYTGDVQWNFREAAGVIRNGYVWVVCVSGCNPGDPVKYNSVTGEFDSGAAASGETQLDDAQFDTAAAAGELAVLRLNSLKNTPSLFRSSSTEEESK